VKLQQIFADADRALAATAGRIGARQWEREVPSAMRWRDDIRTLRDLIGELAGGRRVAGRAQPARAAAALSASATSRTPGIIAGSGTWP
jgi:hypothetical protein